MCKHNSRARVVDLNTRLKWRVATISLSYGIHYAAFMEQISSYTHRWVAVLEGGAMLREGKGMGM